MATRKTDIYIEMVGEGNRLAVYSDLAEYQIKRIEGIISVDEMIGGYSIVVMDKRYDVDEIIMEIKGLAKRDK